LLPYQWRKTHRDHARNTIARLHCNRVSRWKIILALAAPGHARIRSMQQPAERKMRSGGCCRVM
jgi:hypothetical protein